MNNALSGSQSPQPRWLSMHPLQTILLCEHPSESYVPRTKYNATASHITLAFAMDFSSGGEILTKKSVQTAGRHYLALSFLESPQSAKNILKNSIERWRAERAPTESSGWIVNIAGNSAHTFLRKGVENGQVGQFMKEVLSAFEVLGPQWKEIIKVRSGGQTGADSWGAVWALHEGIRAKIAYPKGFRQRTPEGVDEQRGALHAQASLNSLCTDWCSWEKSYSVSDPISEIRTVGLLSP